MRQRRLKNSMKIFLVMVNPRIGPRYVDSAWVKTEAADERCLDLRDSMRAAGNELRDDGLWVWVATCRLQDGALAASAEGPKQ